VRRLLGTGRLEGSGDLGFLVETMPRGGILLVLAEYYVASDRLRKARNCLRKLDEFGLGNRHSAHLHAEILRREGDCDAAERYDWQALTGFLGADARVLRAGADSL
jgi:hypothetical protein